MCDIPKGLVNYLIMANIISNIVIYAMGLSWWSYENVMKKILNERKLK